MDTLPQEGPPAVFDRFESDDAEETLPQQGPIVVLDSSESEDADLCRLVHFWPEDGSLVYYDPQQKAMVLEYTEHADAAALPGCDDQVPGLWFDPKQKCWRLSWQEGKRRRTKKFCVTATRSSKEARADAVQYRHGLETTGLVSARCKPKLSRIPGVKKLKETRPGRKPEYWVQLTHPKSKKHLVDDSALLRQPRTVL